MRVFRTVVPILLLATPLAAQNPPPPPVRPHQEHMQHQAQMQQRFQDMQHRMDWLMTQMRTTNQWMVRERIHDRFQTMGQQMEQTGDQLRLMLREMVEIRKDPTLTRTQDHQRNLDELGSCLGDMSRELEMAHDALRKMIGKP